MAPIVFWTAAFDWLEERLPPWRASNEIPNDPSLRTGGRPGSISQPLESDVD